MTTKQVKIKTGIVLAAIFCSFVIFPNVWAAVYYVNGTEGDDSNKGISEETSWKTIAKVNSSSFSAGDSILFIKGCMWREHLTVPSSGTSSSPITFGAYGTGMDPIINGSVLLSSGWSNYGTNIWRKSLTTQCYSVLFDTIKGKLKNSIGEITSTNEWFWSANYLYVYSALDPGASFISPGVEASQIDVGVYLNGKNYVVVNGLSFKMQNLVAIYLVGNSNNNQILNNTITNQYNPYTLGAIHLQGASNNLVKGNTISYVSVGIYASSYGGETTNANIFSTNDVSYNDDYAISASMGATDTIIEHNRAHNGVLTDDRVSIGAFNPGKGNIFRYNISYDNGDSTHRATGFWVDGLVADIHPVSFYYNIAYGNSFGGFAATGADHSFYNNVSYHNDKYNIEYVPELSLFSSDGSTTYARNVTIKNNIFYGNTKYLLSAGAGNTIGHIINYNIFFGGNAAPFLWGGSSYSFINYKTKSSQDANSLNSDPVLTPDYKLASNSPAIDAGTNVGLSMDYLGTTIPVGTGVDIGAYEFDLKAPPNLRIK